MMGLSPQQLTIVGLPLGAICVTACAGSGKTRTATHRLWEVRQRMKDRHGIVALLSFSNVAVDTFRKDYYVLAREKFGSSNSSSVEIDTMDGFLTANIIRPHAYISMQAKRTPYLVQGHEPFLKGQKVYDGSRPHPTASLEVGIDRGEFKFTASFGYKNAEKDKLQGAFRSMVDTAAIAHADAMILCRSAEWVDKWRGGEEIQGQGAIKAFVSATIFRDKLKRYDDAFRFACAGITSLLADEHGDLAVRIARNDALIDALSLKRMIWKFVRDASLGLPSGSLIADNEWHLLLVKRVRALLVELESRYALKPADNIGNKLAKKALLSKPIIEMPDLASTDLATFHVSTVHQVKGESIEAVMYVASKEQIRAMINGTDTELGRIGYVAVTRARNLLVLAVPENCIGEFEPELVGCGFKKAGT